MGEYHPHSEAVRAIGGRGRTIETNRHLAPGRVPGPDEQVAGGVVDVGAVGRSGAREVVGGVVNHTIVDRIAVGFGLEDPDRLDDRVVEVGRRLGDGAEHERIGV